MNGGGSYDFIKCDTIYPLRFYDYNLINLINTHSSYSFTKKPLLSSLLFKGKYNKDIIINAKVIKDILKVLSSYTKVQTVNSTNNSCISENTKNCNDYGEKSLSCSKLLICNNIKILFDIFPEVYSKILSNEDTNKLNEFIEKMKTFNNDEEHKIINNILICYFIEFIKALESAIGNYTTYNINNKPKIGGKYRKRIKKVE